MSGQHQFGRCLRRISASLVATLVAALLVAAPAMAANPTVTINQASGQADPAYESPIEFTAIFSEPVHNFDAFDIDLSSSTAGGTLLVAVSGGPAIYTISISGMTTSGSVVASIPFGAAEDEAGYTTLESTSTDNSVSWILDKTPPTVTIDAATGQASPTSIAPVFFAVRFSEPVTGFGPASVLLSGSTTGGALAANVAGGPALYSVAVSGMTSAGTVVATIPAGAALDLAGNPSIASTSTDNLVDWLPPPITSGSSAATSSPTPIAVTPARCVVPKLMAKSLKTAKAKLKAADCTLGTVTKHRRPKAKSKPAKVVKQSPKPGATLPAHAAVKVTFG